MIAHVMTCTEISMNLREIYLNMNLKHLILTQIPDIYQIMKNLQLVAGVQQ